LSKRTSVSILKVDTIQKQLQESQKKHEKRLFKFTISRKEQVTENNKPKKDQLESHLKELTGKLETISENLTKQKSEQERLKRRNEKKRLYNSFSASDMRKNLSLAAALESHKTSGSSEDLRLSSSQPAASFSRPRSSTSPVAVRSMSAQGTPKAARDKQKRTSEPVRPKPTLEIDPNALAEIEVSRSNATNVWETMILLTLIIQI
jgi:septal ring factor EnvC (AmiA/AmiB activator)